MTAAKKAPAKRYAKKTTAKRTSGTRKVATKARAPKAAPKKAAPKARAPKAAPKRAPKAAPKRAPKAAPKAAPRARRAAPVALRVSRLPSPLPGPANRQAASRGGTSALGVLGAIAAGGLLVWLLTKPSETPAALPKPPTPVKPPTAPAPSSPSPPVTTKPETAPPDASGPIASWSPDGKTLNFLSGYHRAKQAELNKEIIGLSPSFLKEPVGTVHFVTAGGRDFAVVIEGSHNNHPEIGPTNKGVSIFAKDKA